MPSYEENMQVVLDLRAQVLNPEQDDPTDEELWQAIHAVHATRGIAAKKKAAVKPVVDLASLFAPKEEKKDGT